MKKGTLFQQKVWKAMDLIPKGKVTTYKEIAKFLNTKAYQAVGSAVGKNPNAPKTPCHRVVNSDGRVGNYSGKGGVKRKIELLKNEGVEVKEGKIADFKNKMFYFNKSS